MTRYVNLRHDPSTDHPPIRLLAPPERLELLTSAKTAGYFHVRTGWDGYDIRTIQELLGHAAVKTTMIYTRPQPASAAVPTA